MKKHINWQLFLSLVLVALSILFYFIHYLIFRDSHHIFVYLIGDIAFVFIEVLLVTIVLHQLLHFREKKAIINKVNMVVGAFFSELGMDLLEGFYKLDEKAESIAPKLLVTQEWNEKDFDRVEHEISKYIPVIAVNDTILARLKLLLLHKRDFVLRLLENPHMFEHESFTNLILSVSHLIDELSHRKQILYLHQADGEHIKGDIKRAYKNLLLEWLFYMKHLKNNYPYLFSLALRLNPFDKNASVEIK